MSQNDSPDDKALSELYQQASNETAPAELDQAILAAAMASTESGDSPDGSGTDMGNTSGKESAKVVPIHGFRRWSVPFAAAASLLLCFSVALNIVLFDQQALSPEARLIAAKEDRLVETPAAKPTEKFAETEQKAEPEPRDTVQYRAVPQIPEAPAAAEVITETMVQRERRQATPQAKLKKQRSDQPARAAAKQEPFATAALADRAIADLSAEHKEFDDSGFSVEEFAESNPEIVRQIIALLEQQRYREAKQLLDILVAENPPTE